MKLTNKFNLPETFVNVIKRPTYSKGSSEISVTEILSPPQLVLLRRQHQEDIEQDAADMVWSLFGSAVHNILEHGKDDNHIVEQRLFTTFEGWSISGAIDLQKIIDGKILIADYKVTSAWAVQQEKQEWINQLNLYAWLVERTQAHDIGARTSDGLVSGLQIIGIVRDWSRREAALKDTYPQAPIVTLDIPIWDYSDREEFVRRRLTLHNEANFASISGDMPQCTSEEMWEKKTTYAVMKEGGKRAKKVFEIKEEAAAFAGQQKESHYIETREGGRTRCESFCQAAPFCGQYQTYLKEKS
jgi:hypothetical protein